MENMNLIVLLIIAHYVGDYVLQSEYLATSKGSEWCSLIAHSVLYSVPFYFLFGCNCYLFWYLASTHFVIDSLKARYGKITLPQDQMLHAVVLAIVWCLMKQW